MGKKKDKGHSKPKSRISAADLVGPGAVLVLASVESGSQGGVPVIDELTTYVADAYNVNGAGAAVQQLSVGIDDLVTGAVSLQGAAIAVGAYALHRYLKGHGASTHLSRTRHHIFSVGG